MKCGENYPKEPPVIYFVSQINLPGVNGVDGLVDRNSIGILRDWEAISAQLSKNPRPKEDPLSLEAALIAIRKYVGMVMVSADGRALSMANGLKPVYDLHSDFY